MEPGHHDRVLAVVSHLPHLIAFTICGTADDLADESRQEVLQFAASGFRDFTRIAASDPVMWRDVFLNNREALLEMLARFTEDAQAMARAVRWGDGGLHRGQDPARAKDPAQPDRVEASVESPLTQPSPQGERERKSPLPWGEGWVRGSPRHERSPAWQGPPSLR